MSHKCSSALVKLVDNVDNSTDTLLQQKEVAYSM